MPMQFLWAVYWTHTCMYILCNVCMYAHMYVCNVCMCGCSVTSGAYGSAGVLLASLTNPHSCDAVLRVRCAPSALAPAVFGNSRLERGGRTPMMVGGAWHFFICLQITWPSFEKCLLKSLVQVYFYYWSRVGVYEEILIQNLSMAWVESHSQEHRTGVLKGKLPLRHLKIFIFDYCFIWVPHLFWRGRDRMPRSCYPTRKQESHH